MGDVQMTWRLVRQVLLLITVAALGVLAIAPAVASTGDGPGGSAAAGGAVVHRLGLAPQAAATAGNDSTLIATLESSSDGGATWGPAAGQAMTFAYVTDGAGLVTAINGGPIGSMSCSSDAAGQCTITVRTEAPGESVVTAVAGAVSASTLFG